MSDATTPPVIRFLLAEYCAGPFYAGWWLYARETNDGRPNARSGDWGWLAAVEYQEGVRNLCLRMGRQPPETERYSQAFAKWFAATFPAGLKVVSRAGERWELLAVVAALPKQRRGVIRTIRGAAKAAARRRDRQERETA